MSATMGAKKELGQLLAQDGLLSPEQITRALAHQRQTGKPLGQALLDLDMVTEEDVTRARAKQVSLPYACLQDLAVDKAALALIDFQTARRCRLLPVKRTPDGVLKIIVSTWNAHVLEIATKAAARHRLRVAPALATESHVVAAIEMHYAQLAEHGVPPTSPEAPPAEPPAAPAKRASDLFTDGSGLALVRTDGSRKDEIDSAGGDQPLVIQFINKLLVDGVKQGASDIHFEPRRDALEVRYRIDGTLRVVDSVRRDVQAACASRIKIMAEMNIAERRLPQDGRISVTVDGRDIDMRVSSLPTQHGEALVLRILDKSGVRLSLDQLGFSTRNLGLLEALIRKPHGIFLATGPTGSGKTTTLYSALQAVHAPDVNIITVEDPIEYELDGIRQSNVNEKAGLTFARQLRAILRQDPDIIYVGEIRDAETAEIAFRAALTGHLVFSSLHCNDAAGAITRLLNMNVDPFLVASSVIGIMAQRLVRKVCPYCVQPVLPSALELSAFGIDLSAPGVGHPRFRQGAGCEACGGTGYKGRCGVQELMAMDEEVRAMTLSGATSGKIRQVAMARGMVPMREDAGAKIRQGITTFDEARKRVFVEEDAEG